VASLEFAGDNGSLSDINATQGEFRTQIAALNDLMRQLAGTQQFLQATTRKPILLTLRLLFTLTLTSVVTSSLVVRITITTLERLNPRSSALRSSAWFVVSARSVRSRRLTVPSLKRRSLPAKTG